jgi:hypothetical protein
MAYRLVKQGGKLDYNYKEYYLDTDSDLSTLPVGEASPGSIAYSIASGKVYMLNTLNQ